MQPFNKNQLTEQSKQIIFEMFYNKVYSTAYYVTKDYYLAQDITQETFIKAFKQIHNLKDTKKIESWLGTIATRTAIDYIRKIKKQNELVSNDVFIDINTFSKKESSKSQVEKSIEDKFIKNEIQKSISELKPEYRQVIVLKYDYELKDEEIAKELDMTLSAVKGRIHRAKNKLKSVLSKHIKFEEGELG